MESKALLGVLLTCALVLGCVSLSSQLPMWSFFKSTGSTHLGSDNSTALVSPAEEETAQQLQSREEDCGDGSSRSKLQMFTAHALSRCDAVGQCARANQENVDRTNTFGSTVWFECMETAKRKGWSLFPIDHVIRHRLLEAKVSPWKIGICFFYDGDCHLSGNVRFALPSQASVHALC